MIKSTGRGVLHTRFRGYDGGAYDQRDLFVAAMTVKQFAVTPLTTRRPRARGDP